MHYFTADYPLVRPAIFIAAPPGFRYYLNPTVMSQVTCCLLRLNQYRLNESDGEELCIYHDGKKIWPKERSRYKVVKNPVTELNLRFRVEKDQKVVLDLFEYDWFIFKKRIGSFLIRTDSFGGPFSTDISLSENLRYNLEWLVF